LFLIHIKVNKLVKEQINKYRLIYKIKFFINSIFKENIEVYKYKRGIIKSVKKLFKDLFRVPDFTKFNILNFFVLIL